MASHTQPPVTPTGQKLLLVDFDWRDTDLLPELFRRAGVSVRLVVGHGPQDPGWKLAEVCGLPRTLDLADLTREIFDLALVGERSSRRTQLESLLLALGTPCTTLEQYLSGRSGPEDSRPGVEGPLSLHAAALEQTLTGTMETIVDEALPDLDVTTPLGPRPEPISEGSRLLVHTLEDFPSPEVRSHLEETLKALVEHTGAGSAELHAGDRTHLRLLAQVGPDDRLLKGLVDMASESGTPQLVTRLNDPGKGRTWAAWPFRSMQRRGVVAGGAIDPRTGLDKWQAMVDELRRTWDTEDRERSIAAYPLTPFRQPRWLPPGEFRDRVDLAVERHRRDGLRFELHRLEFPDTPTAIEKMCGALPAQVRDTDALSQPFTRVALLLVTGEPEAFTRFRQRVLELWSDAWGAAEMAPPPASIVDRSVALSGPEDVTAFTGAADLWLVEP
jgi:hypothetical protein